MAALNKLGKIAAVGFVACCSTYFLFQKSLSKNLLGSQFCKEAMELVKNHNGAKLFLGEPIEPEFAKFTDFSKNSGEFTVQVFVTGPKSKGEVFLTVNKTSENQAELDSVQLQIGKDVSKRLEIKSAAEVVRI